MPIKTFYSIEAKNWVRKRFIFFKEFNGMQLFKLSVDLPYLWVELPETPGTLVPAHFNERHVLNHPEKIQKDINEWKKAVADFYEEQRLINDFLPPEAIYFGYTQSQIDYGLVKAKERQEQAAIKRDEEFRAKKQKEKQEKDRRNKELLKKIGNGENVTGPELAHAARILDVEVHPRTVGMLRQRVRKVNSNSATITGKKLFSMSIYELYDICSKLARETVEPVNEDDAETAKLLSSTA